MNKNHTLRFRVVDKINFDHINSKLKTIETRAGSEQYKKVAAGDTLTIICGKERVIKTVSKVHYFKTIGALLKAMPMRKIMPDMKTESDARKRWNSYPGYKERIKKFGIVAWELK